MKNIFKVMEIIVLSLFVLMFIGCIALELALPESAVSVWIKENVWDITKTVASVKAHVPVLINSLIYVILVYAVCRILRLFFKSRAIE